MELEKRIFNFAVWLVVLSVLMVILTSCTGFDPYAGLQVPTATAAAQSSTVVELLPTLHRDERWSFHNLDDWALTLTIRNRKAGHE